MIDDDLQARIRLHHKDRPKLDDMGFINWNPGTGEIVKGTDFEVILPLLEIVVDHEEDLPHDWL